MRAFDPMDAAKAALDIVMLIALFELKSGFTFPYDTVRDDVSRLKASLMEVQQ